MDPPERPMIPRPVVMALFLGLLARPLPAQAGAPLSRAENVLVVTLDGFRHQGVFAGADESLIDARAGGVPDATGLKRRFWRETAEARRERPPGKDRTRHPRPSLPWAGA